VLAVTQRTRLHRRMLGESNTFQQLLGWFSEIRCAHRIAPEPERMALTYLDGERHILEDG